MDLSETRELPAAMAVAASESPASSRGRPPIRRMPGAAQARLTTGVTIAARPSITCSATASSVART